MIPIGPILEHYGWTVPHERPGNVNVKCGEHDDKRASASINFEKGLVKCHGCEFAGDAIKVVMLKEGMEYGEAKRFAAGIAGEGDEAVSGQPRPRHAVSIRSGVDEAYVRNVQAWRRGIRGS